MNTYQILRRNLKLGISSPNESYKKIYPKKSFESFYKKLKPIEKGCLRYLENNENNLTDENKNQIILDIIEKGLNDNIPLKYVIKLNFGITIYDIFNLEFITDNEKSQIIMRTIMFGLKNNKSLKNIIKEEFKNIYIDDILSDVPLPIMWVDIMREL
ncbi:hypothetical protein M0Q97_11990 [Candidatus Dojkabacteria bacterium]|jgi:hypothetical protein|nr:hypothetical protein [Candidatus Dojkabacteria bacterium]